VNLNVIFLNRTVKINIGGRNNTPLSKILPTRSHNDSELVITRGLLLDLVVAVIVLVLVVVVVPVVVIGSGSR